MEPVEIKTWLQIAAAIASLPALYGIPKALKWMKNQIATMMATAVMAQLNPILQGLHGEVAAVRAQVFPNGGGSMNDKLTSVLHTTQRTEQSVTMLHATVRAHQDADLSHARFEADAHGLFEWVSHAFLLWCNRGIEQVRGHGWINCVAPEDRDRVREEWDRAIAERREFFLQFRMRVATGEEFRVEAFAKPIRAPDAAEADRWVGVISRLA